MTREDDRIAHVHLVDQLRLLSGRAHDASKELMDAGWCRDMRDDVMARTLEEDAYSTMVEVVKELAHILSPDK